MGTFTARDTEMEDETPEEPTEHGDWFQPTDDWDEILKEFEGKDNVWIGIAVAVLIIGNIGKPSKPIAKTLLVQYFHIGRSCLCENAL